MVGTPGTPRTTNAGQDEDAAAVVVDRCDGLPPEVVRRMAGADRLRSLPELARNLRLRER